MPVAAQDFFAAVDADPRPRVPPGLNGTLRFDVRDGADTEQWRLRFQDGRVTAAPSAEPADCVVVVDRQLFDRILQGVESIEPAFVRQAFTVEGLLPLLLSFRWLLPDAVGARRPRDLVSGWSRAR
ncbi:MULTISPECIES: SCP2 sterol-binding domain-containing protein [unclassified Solwaraspora]|uniref:SCP2 sterol-binding domain-containing protein n=1 Tax=unclassified Solwaraspora TaxID=2627926 RepID=UPI00259AF310|nr:SCP2 sterol-binding domain-containing protein [Solwaraspora sp. WMMA2056]WJK41374.1 SCP2 sterol-binding domain-containing protein [Solwaraspora sp. WMMA2056]